MNFNGENFMKIGPEMTGRIFGKKRALYIIYRKKTFVHKYKKKLYGTILYVMFHFTQFE